MNRKISREEVSKAIIVTIFIAASLNLAGKMFTTKIFMRLSLRVIFLKKDEIAAIVAIEVREDRLISRLSYQL